MLKSFATTSRAQPTGRCPGAHAPWKTSVQSSFVSSDRPRLPSPTCQEPSGGAQRLSTGSLRDRHTRLFPPGRTPERAGLSHERVVIDRRSLPNHPGRFRAGLRARRRQCARRSAPSVAYTEEHEAALSRRSGSPLRPPGCRQRCRNRYPCGGEVAWTYFGPTKRRGDAL